SLQLQLLVYGCQRRIVKSSTRYIVEAYHRTTLRHLAARLSQSSYGSAGREIVKGDKRGEVGPMSQQLFRELIRFAECRIAPLDFQNQPRIHFESNFLRKILQPLPALQTVDQDGRPFDKCNSAMTETIQVLEREPRACGVVDNHRTYRNIRQFTTDHH